ncbi:MAG: ferredoxin--NADP reductase [Bacteroidetes bacterium]|nr:ferredoxin--NADP reductase [Bacteroidota bacterium]
MEETAKNIILEVKEIIKETTDTITIKFDNTNLKYRSGQYLLLKILYEGKILSRAYSLSSSPFIDEFPAITIKRVIGGKISNYLNDQIEINHKIISSKPKGNFVTTYNSDNQRNIVCISAGSGITPLISIIKSVLSKEENSKITLIYINRNQNTVIFKKYLDDLITKYEDQIKIINILTQPLPNWDGIIGRPDSKKFETIFKTIIYDDDNSMNSIDEISNKLLGGTDNYQFFLCGPIPMMKNAISALKNIGIKENNIFLESFGKANNKESNIKKEEKENFEISKVKILYEEKNYEIEVKADETILEAALDEDIDLPFACSSGTCNVCQAICKKGKVEMENDEGLTEEEIQQNYILTCVSRPKSEKIEIEIPDEF